uniref:Cation-transporting ATPase n=1 Tax=Triatoma infestans TaxID=30076 RepID=A0A023F2U2_TRIIF
MPSTPKGMNMGFQRNSYSKVSFAKTVNHNYRADIINDSEPLQDCKTTQQNGNVQNDVCADYINYGMDDQMEIKGFVKDKVRSCIIWIFIVLTVGTLRLVFHWWPHWMLYATHRPSSLDIAEKVLVIERYQQKHKCYHVKNIKIITSHSTRECIKEDDQNTWDQHLLMELEKLETTKLSVHMSGGYFKEMDTVRLFKCKKITYVWDPDENIFYKLRGLDLNIAASALHLHKGLSASQQFFRRAVYGANEIIVPMRSITALLLLEVLNPFYIFQIFSFILWMVDDYVYYALAILFMSCCSISVAVAQTRRNQINLSSRVHSRDVASIVRGNSGENEVIIIPTEQLVPGDVLVLPSHGCIMHCDAVLLTGNCIVNESMLTGESVPVTKTPMPNSTNILYNDKEHARHTLFCGTQVIQTRYYGHERVYAVVIRTSFSTAKGSLVRSILYPPPVDFKFEHDSYKFVQLLAIVAAIGVLYTVITKVLRGNNWSDITLEALDLITIVVPPALPAAMTVGRMYAQARLEKSNIFCISPRTINVSGSINCVCFDKTGTLTEDGLDMWGVVPVNNSKYQLPVKNIKDLPIDHLLKAMVTCHAITVIDGNLAGDPLDIKMFESTGWVLEEPEVSDAAKFDLISPTVVKPPSSEDRITEDLGEVGLEVGIIRQFPFSSSLQRMSVITRRLGARQFTLYCKGSPEMIHSLCDPKTVPVNFESELETYTREGYRVLGIGYKDLPAKLSYAKMQRLSRDEAESSLTFLGLVIMENRLKPQTTGVIHMLRDANVRTIMVTGDNMLTAVSVARDCGIVPPGQRVIMVQTSNEQSKKPNVYFTQSRGASSPDTVQMANEISEMTYTESITSFQTIDSVVASTRTANGNARNSIIAELPFDDNIVEDGIFNTDYCFALTGPTWTALRTFYPELMVKIATRGAIFSRMSPDHKQQLVQELQALEYFVAMVGDGANDCGALKAAHAGISLSEAESSVASPFTSKESNISCIVEVIREGRAALVTSFAIFKYMAAYSLMQFASVIILYSIDSNLTDIEYLYIDLFVITTFAFVLGRVEAFKGALYPKPPQSSLISLAPISSLLIQMVIAIGAQLISFYLVQTCSWYHKTSNSTESDLVEGGYENYSVFTVSSLQYIILALVFSKGAPYRQSLFTSPGLMVATIIITMFTLYLVLYPCQWLIRTFELVLPPTIDFRLLLIAFGLVNLVLAAVCEYLCDFIQEYHSKVGKKRLLGYELQDKWMNEKYTWPPLSSEQPPPLQNSPILTRPEPPTVTVINSPSNKKLLGRSNSSDLQLDELKFCTPLRSVQSLLDGQSEDSLAGYVTPPSSIAPTPAHHIC